MKTTQKLIVFAAALALAAAVSPDAGDALQSHEVNIYGSANIKSWSAKVHQLNVISELLVEDGQLTEIRKVRVEIDVEAIEGSDGRAMTRDLHETFNKENHPRIVFELKEILELEAVENGYRIRASGELSMAGHTRTIELEVDGEVLDDEKIEFSGTKTMLMTDWEMSPPTALLGVLRTRDEVEVEFRIVVAHD